MSLRSGIALDKIHSDAIVAVTKIRNEAPRLPFWLAYHRWLGVDHFIVIENRSTDQTEAFLSQQPDVTLIQASGPFGGPRGYENWISEILAVAPQQRWNLVLDADELFVILPWRQGGIREAVTALANESVDVVSAIMVDCYPGSYPMEGLSVPAVPWQRAPWFDRGPYVTWDARRRRPRQIYHGIRERIFWQDWHWQRHIPKFIRKRLAISQPPSIVKRPLFRNSFNADFSIHRQRHDIKRRANTLSYILHYKIDFDLGEKISSALREEQYFNFSSEYKRYEQILKLDPLVLHSSRSVKFTGHQSLATAKLYTGHIRNEVQRTFVDHGTNCEAAVNEIREFGGPSPEDRIALTPSQDA